jgi:hypothetical protein
MKIIAPPISPDAAAVPARSTTAYALQWRKALEEAQWQARLRMSPHDHAEPAPQPSPSPESDEAPRAPNAGQRVAASGDASGLPPAAKAPRADAQATTIAQFVQRLAASATSVAQPVASPAAMRIATLAGEPVPLPAETAPPNPALYFELPEWPEVVVQASVNGSTISVGVRDRMVEAGEALDLFYRLRAQLRAAGLALTSLTVNGQTIAPERHAAGDAYQSAQQEV